MLISYNWLQNYFKEKLPPPEKLAELLAFSFAEVESIEAIGSTEQDKTKPTRDKTEKDYIFDVKVLPDRACYALSHRGVAYEVAAITGFKRKQFDWPQPKTVPVRELSVRVEAPELCSRYMARVIENVTPKEMPWVTEHLAAVGQRTIHPVVDGANIVMFDMGQPLHAFDADKVEGGIVVRRARRGEKITTLDNQEVALDEAVLVIADEKSPLAIAGIKGGMKAAVTPATRNLILEAASFNASYIRKTAERLGIRTDASKRFESKLSPSLASVGMNDFTAFLFEMDKNLKAGEVIDWYPKQVEVLKLKVGKDALSAKLGVAIHEKEIESIFSRLEFLFEKKGDGWLITPPAFRMDLSIPEDIAEEVGRLYGYEKIPAMLPPRSKGRVEIPKSFYYEWKIREILVDEGFSEVMTSSFAQKADIEILNPLASDKGYLRKGLIEEMKWNCLEKNRDNSDLLGLGDSLKIFEMGKVFPKGGEHLSLAIGVDLINKKKDLDAMKEVREAFQKIFSVLKVIPEVTVRGNNLTAWGEVNLDTYIEQAPELKAWDITILSIRAKKFKPFSLYPFIVRDIALFVPPELKPEAVTEIIKENAGNLVVRGPELFDEFSKDGRKSLAFRLVFQSFDRTLSDEEVNKIMGKIYAAIRQKGWEVR